ncbi:MmcQ/YjbR family DNA-binding protein [Bacteroides heparinolyticus]|uniref:MmcQ/YjbR family DNA-binding protein n=2 Tax=Prevotella heparinolytica TaxID=28113 RepID=UPI0035A0018C
MNLEELRTYCLSLPKVTEDTPFGENFLVFRIYGKIFALTDMDSVPSYVNLKCDPDKAVELREEYTEITAGYHMNKKHWNTLQIEKLPSGLIQELIRHSYEEVLKKVPKRLLASD